MNRMTPTNASARRQWLMQATRLGATLAAASMLGAAGCGFKLRRSYDMAFKTVQLTGFAGNSPLAAELARALEASGVTVVDSTLEATQAASAALVPRSHVVIEGTNELRDTLVSTPTAYGQVRGVTARIQVNFQVKRGDGSVLLPMSVVGLALDMTYDEKDALAKQSESAALQRAMQTDLVNQIMRRLAAIRPEQLEPPSEPSRPVSASASAKAAAEAASGSASGAKP